MENGVENTNNAKMGMAGSEAELISLIDSDDLEMPSWDDGCYHGK